MLYLSVHDSGGDMLTRFSDIMSITSKKVVNGVGFIKFTVLANHPAVGELTHLNIIKLYRKELRYAVTWYEENIGIILDRRYIYEAGHAPMLEITAFHPNYLLLTRMIAYYSGVTGRSKFLNIKVETIAKGLVIWNATTAADANRLRNGQYTLYPIQVESSADHGAQIDFFCSMNNLLTALQRLARIGVGDFNLVDIGGGRFEFRWYDGQLGTDRRASVLFALERGNMAQPVYMLKHSQEATVAFAAGQGEGALRQVAVRYGDDYTVQADIETFVYGIHAATFDGLATLADNRLDKQRYIPTLTFDVVQTPGTYYGKHYFLGDLVSVRNPFTEETFVTKIDTVTLEVAPIVKEKKSSGGMVKVGITLTSNTNPDEEILNPWLITDISEGIYTENLVNPTTDGQLFTDTVYNYNLDGAGFTDSFLAESIDAGLFAPPPG